MATLSAASDRPGRRALATALRFAIGHAVALGGLSALCLLAGVGLSEAFERWAEILGGVVLTGLALAALMFPGALRHGHPHLPGHERDHLHARMSAAAGALMAFSGARSLLLALPPLLVGGGMHLAAWAYLPGFALGILLGMGTVGLLIAYGLERLGERVQRAVVIASAALGVFWIAVRL
jgi:nickel/cobalt transporter (NicO) family protein